MNHKPSGVFIYTPDGRLSTHIMKTPPLTPQEGRRTPRDSPHARDFLAYQGTYPVGPDAGILTRQVVGALKPAYVATRRQRPSRIDGDELWKLPPKLTALFGDNDDPVTLLLLLVVALRAAARDCATAIS